MGSYIPITVIVAFVILIAVGLVVLHIFLSLQKNKWFGLILPIMHTLFMSTAILLAVVQKSDPYAVSWLVFSLFLIPETIFFVIYAICQSHVQAKGRKSDEISRMKIQDLK